MFGILSGDGGFGMCYAIYHFADFDAYERSHLLPELFSQEPKEGWPDYNNLDFRLECLSKAIYRCEQK